MANLFRRCVLCAWVVVASISVAGRTATITPGTDVAPHRLIRVKPGEGERVFVVPLPSANAPQIDVVTAVTGEIIWTGPPGVYFVFWFSDTGQGQSTVTIGNSPTPPPGPPPPPPPDPQPQPTVPNKYKVGQVAFDQAEIVARPEQASQLAAIYRSAASQLAGLIGVNFIEDLNTVTTAIGQQTADALGVDVGRWQGWRDAVRVRLKAAWEAGIKERSDWVAIFQEIATALEKSGAN